MRAPAEVMTGRPRGPGRERAGHRAYQRAERRPLLERSVREQIEDRRRGGDQSDHGADQRREVGRAEYRERDTNTMPFVSPLRTPRSHPGGPRRPTPRSESMAGGTPAETSGG